MTVSSLAIGLATILYVLTRSITVGATYDEVSTIQYFVPESVAAIVTLTTAVTTPDHILNTLLIKLLFATGYETLFVARLPNVVACALYLYCAYRISRRCTHPSNAIGLFLLFVLNPFVLDFFGLARGYGLALAAQVASMSCLLDFMTATRPKRSLALALLAAALSVLCVLSWLHYFIAAAGVALGATLLYNRALMPFALRLVAAVSVGLGLIIYGPIRRMQQLNMFFYGGDRDFYHDTLVSLAKYTAYLPDPTRMTTLVLDAVLAMTMAAIVVSLFRTSPLKRETTVAVALLVLPVVSTVSQHYVLGTPYPIDRAALYFYPLGVLALCLAASQAVGRPFISPAIAAVVVAAGVNALVNANVYKAAMWSFDAHAERILTAINDAGASQHAVQRLDFAWPFEQSTKYHLAHGSFPYVRIVEHPADPDEFNRAADYYIHLGRPLEKLSYDPLAQHVLAAKKDVMTCFAPESVCVFRLR